MKLPVKILLINIGIALFFSLMVSSTISGSSSFSYQNLSIAFGLVNIFGGVVDLIIGLFLLFKEDKRYAQGFLLSAGTMIMLGFAVCSATKI